MLGVQGVDGLSTFEANGSEEDLNLMSFPTYLDCLSISWCLGVYVRDGIISDYYESYLKKTLLDTKSDIMDQFQ